MPALRLIFMGTPEFSVPALTALRAAGHKVVAVYTQPPRPAHRGQKETPSPVHRAALAQGMPVFVPKSLKKPEAQAEFLTHGADAAVVVAYGLLLPPAILEAPRLGCFNIHASLLPRWRGAAPIQHALLSGDAETGICIMKMDAGLDTGSVALRAATAITAEDTAQSLHDRLSILGAEQIVKAMALLSAGDLPLIPQPETGETYARKLSKEDGRLDFAASAKSLARQVRALTPWPGCWFALKGQKEQRLKVLAAEDLAAEALAAEALPPSSAPLKPEPGTLLSSDFTLATGDGVLKLTRVAREGRAPMDGLSCLRGLPYKVGENILAEPSAGKGQP